MDDLLSLLMSNTAAGAELGLSSASSPAPAAVFAGAAMPVATAGGEAVEVRSPGEQQRPQLPPLLSAASPVLLTQSVAAAPLLVSGALSPHGSAIPQDLFKSAEAWTKPSAPAPAPAPATAPTPTPTPTQPEPEPEPAPPPALAAQPPPHPSQVRSALV